jgi:hypothetical protein
VIAAARAGCCFARGDVILGPVERGLDESRSTLRGLRVTRLAQGFEHAVVIDAICIVRWGKNPTADVVREVTARLLAARRKLKRQLALIVIPDPSMKAAEPGARDEFIRNGPSFAMACACAFAVIGPDVEHRQVQLGFFEAMRAFNPVPSEYCESTEEALRRASQAVGANAEAVIAEARRRGVLERE